MENKKLFRDKSQAEMILAHSLTHLTTRFARDGGDAETVAIVTKMIASLKERLSGINSSKAAHAFYCETRALEMFMTYCERRQMAEITLSNFADQDDIQVKAWRGRLAAEAQYFGKEPQDQRTIDWSGYQEHLDILVDLDEEIRKEYYARKWEAEKKAKDSLDEEIDPMKPLRKIQHDGFLIVLKNFDFYYSYSDDIVVYRNGSRREEEIKQLSRKHPHLEKMRALFFHQMNPGRDDHKFVQAEFDELRKECSE